MKANSLAELKLHNTQFWLLAIAGGLIAIHLSLSWRSDPSMSQFSLSVLCWAAVLSLLWDKRHKLILESDIFSSLLGLSLIAFVLFRSAMMTSFDAVFNLTPLIAGLGLAMLASGVKRIPQYWQELIIILALNAPVYFLVNRINILSLYTAKAANFILAYLGVEVYRQGINIIFANGRAVEVASGCSGWESIFPLLKLSVIFLVMFPTSLVQKLLVPTFAVLIAFIVNAVRVAMMAILFAYTSEENFNYWHTGSGSQIFFLTSTLLFALCCYFITQNQQTDNQERGLSKL